MNTEQIKEMFEKPAFRLESSMNLNPGVDFRFHTTYGHAGKSTVHAHEFYEVFLTIEGNIIHCINKTVQILDPGCLVFIRPDDVHGYVYNEGEKYEFVNLAIGKELLESMIEYIKPAFDCSDLITCSLPPVTRLTKTETGSLLNKLNNLNLIDSSNVTEQKMRVRVLLLEIFSEYFFNKKSVSKTGLPLWLEETCRLMKNPENFTAGQKRMAEISGKTPEHLSRTMQKFLGITPTKFINELRINYAANLIANTNLKITDICYESGFGNISHFYTVFNATYKMSPNRFRETRTLN